MAMIPVNEEREYLHKVYRNITFLGILLHVLYSLIFFSLQYPLPFIYNLLDMGFYIAMMFLVTRYNRYTLAVSLMHLESMLFSILHTILFGWNPTFHIFLIAMGSLVYFCPYRLYYIPYLFSFLHFIIFFILYSLSLFQTSIIELPSLLTHTFFVCNNIAAFIIILYVGYVSKASATVGKKELLEKNKNLLHLTNYDQMTGLFNRACLRNTYADYQCEKNVLAIGDIDDFKNVNDTYGHICGDVILKEIAEQMRKKLDPNIFLCRWGGEEFIFIFRCNEQDAKNQLQEFCHWIETYEFHYQDSIIHITMTFGLASNKDIQTLEKWIEEADRFLYNGKRNGKNRVVSKELIKKQ